MLTIEEIKKALDTGNAVGLECVDADMYCRTDSAFKHEREVIARSSLVITSIIGQGDFKALMISSCRYCIPENDLKHFLIKRPAPTFDDLIGAAVKAHKDLVVITFKLDGACLYVTHKGNTYGWSKDNPGDGIDFINSLYTETFTVQGEDDIKRIKPEAKAALANGVEIWVKEANGSEHINACEINSSISITLNILALKGATVTQKRGAL